MKHFTHFFRVLTLCLVTLVSSGAWATVQTYQKVTSAPTDWSGEYLIVYETGNCAMNGSLTALDGESNFQSVTITDNTISLDDSYSFTIASMTGGYSIQANSGKYIGNTANSNALTSSDKALANTLSLSADGSVDIVSSGGAYLRYNATSGQTRFRYFRSSSYKNQKAIHLYKKSTTPPTDVLKSLTVSGTPTKTTYEAGEAFDPAGLTVTGTYSESGNKTVTHGITWTYDPETLTAGTTSVSVTAKVGSVESSEYIVNGLTVTEKETPGTNLTLTFDMSKNPGGWPTVNSTTLTNYTYTLDEVDYTFALKNVKSNSGYMMLTATAALGLPAIPGYKLTKVVAKNSGGCSTAVNVGVSSSDSSADYIEGGDAQKWATQSSSYTYTLSETDANSVYYLYATSKNAQIVSLELTYEAATPTTTPSISASNVDIAADATSGEIAYEITNPVEGQTLSASTEATWISNIQVAADKVTFTTTANTEASERTANITLKYEGATDKVVTVTQKGATVALTTIDQIFAKATEAGSTATEVSVKFDGWYVTGVKGSNAYATDGTKGFIIYGNGHGFVVGDALTGTVTCKVQLFNGSAEFTELTTSTEGLTVTHNHAITTVEKTIDQLSGINTGAVVTIKNITYDGEDFTDGTNTIVPFNSLMTLPTFEENGKYNITGVYLQYGGKKEILPRSEADIEALTTTKYTITWSVNGTTTDEEVNEGADIDFKPATVPAGFTDYVFRGWITNATVEGTTEPTYVTEATATADVTYYAVFAKKTTTGGSGNYELVTENQSDWSGDYLIAYSEYVFADGRVGGTTGSGMGVQNVKVDPEDNLDGTTVAASWGDQYNVTLEKVSKDSGTYLMLTKDGKYNYQTANSNGLAVTENRTTAEDHPITINFVSSKDVQLIVHDACIFHYNTQGYFRFYKNGGQSPVYLYKKQAGTVTYSDFCTILPAGLPVVIGSTGYATFYDRDNRIIPTGVKAYYCTQGEEGVLNTVQITNLSYIPRWTGVILEGTPGTYYLEEIPTIMADEEETDKIMDDNVLNGTLDDMSVEDLRAELGDYLVYVLSKVDGRIGFYKFAGDTLAGRKAFYVNANALVSGFILDFGMETVGVSTVVNATNLKADYDLTGRKVVKSGPHGIFLQKGRKLIR